jgi:hypothetical protein
VGIVVAIRTSHINIEMHFIIFLYLLISGIGEANAERYLPFRGAAKRKPFGSAQPFINQAMLSHPPFPSLPAAVHWQDSADTWRKSLGTAKTGGALPSGSVIPKLQQQPSNIPIKTKNPPAQAVNYYKKKFLRGG